jgi:polysaccharide deacetylase 2 family uncharacterized protein YibQ
MAAPRNGDGKRSSAARLLSLAILMTLGATALLLLLIAFTGSPEDGAPRVTLLLAPPQNPEGQPVLPLPQSARSAGGHLVADPALIEQSEQGPLPVVAADGRMARTAYAQPFDLKDKRPRIAFVITGLGVGTAATDAALNSAPPEATLAFVPFAADLQNLIDRARAAGHEVLLEVPMEPFDYPASDPGPSVLLVAGSAKDNVQRLNRVLARATGYVGISNLLGARYLGEMAAIGPTLDEAGKRGLLFFDSGTASNSLALTAARHAGMPIATGMVRVEDGAAPDAIAEYLAMLESVARQAGSAVGTAEASPPLLEQLAAWAEGLAGRGFAFAPVSAVAEVPQAAVEP